MRRTARLVLVTVALVVLATCVVTSGAIPPHDRSRDIEEGLRSNWGPVATRTTVRRAARGPYLGESLIPLVRWGYRAIVDFGEAGVTEEFWIEGNQQIRSASWHPGSNYLSHEQAPAVLAAFRSASGRRVFTGCEILYGGWVLRAADGTEYLGEQCFRFFTDEGETLIYLDTRDGSTKNLGRMEDYSLEPQ